MGNITIGSMTQKRVKLWQSGHMLSPNLLCCLKNFCLLDTFYLQLHCVLRIANILHDLYYELFQQKTLRVKLKLLDINDTEVYTVSELVAQYTGG